MGWGTRRHVTVIALAAVLGLSGCTGGAGGVGGDATTAIHATADATTSATDPSTGPTASSSAETAFRAWLAASRKPDVEAACRPLDPDLVTRMIAELNATAPTKVTDCAGMITATAALFRATGQSADVSIDIRDESATHATLFVTYSATGKCGAVDMTRAGSPWTITDQSEACTA